MEDEKQIKKSKLKELMNLDIKDVKINFAKIKKEKKQNKKVENKKEVISFDISEDFIRVVVGKFYKETLTISKCIEVFTPKDSIQDGKIINEQTLVKVLKQILSENKIKAKYASFTTNSTLIINREMVIPKVEEDELQTVISYEISQYLPINLNDYIIQTKTLDEIEVNGVDKLKVYTICYPEKIARNYNELLKKLNLRPFALDVKFNSLSKIINYSQEINDKEYKIMDSNAFIAIGSVSTEINIYNAKGIDFTRIIKVGYKNVEEYKVNDINNLGVDYLIEETDRIFQFYKNKTRGNKIDKVYLLGEGSRLKGLDEYMSKKVGIKVESINNIGFVEFTFKGSCDNEMYKYLNAMGTIIRL